MGLVIPIYNYNITALGTLENRPVDIKHSQAHASGQGLSPLPTEPIVPISSNGLFNLPFAARTSEEIPNGGISAWA